MDDGRSGADAPSGLRPFGAEPQDASQAKPLVPNAARDRAEAEAAKRERHKAKSLVHKHWKAICSPEKGWHVALVDDPFHAEFAARMLARAALLRGDMNAFQKHAGEALLARCASAIEAAAAGETVQLGSTEGESAVPDRADAQHEDTP